MRIPHFILVAVVFLFAFSCTQKDTLNISGEIENFQNNQIFLYTENNQFMEVDTLFLDENGKFKIEKNLPEPSVITIISSDKDKWIPLFLYPGETVDIKIDELNPNDFQVKGSRVQKEFEAFLKNNNNLIEEESIVSKEIEKKTYLGDEGIIGRTRFLSNLNGVKKKLSEASEAYLLKNSSQISASVILNEFFNDGATYKVAELIDSLKGDAETFVLTSRLRQQLNNLERTEVGKEAPLFTIQTTKGHTFSLDSLKGKNVLLSFTASWCEFCKVETKALLKYFDQNKKQAPLDIISVSLDENASDWLAHAKEGGITWEHCITDTLGVASSLLQLYNVHEVPYTVLIDTAGIIVGRGNSCDEFRDIFSKTDSTSVK